MKSRTLSFLVVALFAVMACIATQVNAASQEVQKQNLLSVQAQANASKPIPVALPIKAQIEMKGGDRRDGKVVNIDQKEQTLWIQGSRNTKSFPLSQVEKIVFPKDSPVYLDPRKSHIIIRGEGTPPGRPETWRGILMNAFRLVKPETGQAELNLESVVSADKLDGIRTVIAGNGKNTRQFVVDEMQFDVQKKTMTIKATPY
jgi:hypothetical protein